MNMVIERCAGLDVHKKTVVACVRTPGPDPAKLRRRQTRTFSTTLKGLEALRAWLATARVTDAASPRGTSARMEERVATSGHPAPLLARSRVIDIPWNQ